MPQNELEFVSYLSRHFRLVEALCTRQIGFQSHDELMSFLAAHTDVGDSLSHRAGRLKEVGILVEGATGWMPPPFLVKFMRELRQRHVLASPEIVQGWIGQLDVYSQQLASEVERLQKSPVEANDEHVLALLNDVEYTFSEIVRIVHSNCERIASEVAEYRTTEDVASLRRRLTRLISLHEEYLQPLIHLVDIKGAFYDVAERISHTCDILASREIATSWSVRQKAISVRHLVVWLRMAVIRQAEEAKRELAPLCLAAAQEHRIATGVNRALEFARRGEWELLDIPKELRILDDKNRHLFSDLAFERYLTDVQCFKQQLPPIVQLVPPVELASEITASELIKQLDSIGGSNDILDWVLENDDKIPLEKAIQLLHDVIELAPTSTVDSDQLKTYSRSAYEAEAYRWAWRNNWHDNNKPIAPNAPEAGRSLSSA